MVKKQTRKYKIPSVTPHVLPNIEDWPIYLLSEDRRQFVKDIQQFTLDRLLEQPSDQLSDLIAQTIYLELIRIKEEPWKVDPPKERQFWNRIRSQLVRHSLDQPEEQALQNNREILEQIIQRYSEEIVGTFRIKFFLFARRFLTFFFNRLLQAKQRGFFRFGGARKRLYEKLKVSGDLEQVQELFKEGILVVVPTHHSNLDSIVIGYALDAIAGLPSFSYGAGLNLYNTGYTAYFMNRLGAYRVDRRKKNSIYLETLKAMSNLSIQRGVNTLFFPGGTRSRSGALETRLKLGLLSTVVEAQRALLQQGIQKKVFVVPMVVSYHFVLEAPQLIEQHLKRSGKERYIKIRESSSNPFKLFRFIWQVLAEGNDITISFGQPMDVLGNEVDHKGQSFDQYGNLIHIDDYFRFQGLVQKDLQRESEYTKILGERIVERYHRDNIVLTSHLVAFAAFNLLKLENDKLDLYGILRLPSDNYEFSIGRLELAVQQLQARLLDMEQQGLIKLSEQIHRSVPEIIADGIQHLGTFHVKKPLRYNRKGAIISDSFRTLYFYHNRLENYQLHKVLNIKTAIFGVED